MCLSSTEWSGTSAALAAPSAAQYISLQSTSLRSCFPLCSVVKAHASSLVTVRDLTCRMYFARSAHEIPVHSACSTEALQGICILSIRPATNGSSSSMSYEKLLLQSPALLQTFDELVLLKRGGVIIYSGKLGKDSSTMVSYFESIPGVPKIPANYNPVRRQTHGLPHRFSNAIGSDHKPI